MADQIGVVKRGGGAPAPARTPASVADARQAIETTRERISRDLDLIEERVRSKKDRLQAKAPRLDSVRGRVRAQPWKSIAGAAGVGLLLGLLTGGGDKETDRGLTARDRRELDRLRAELHALRDQRPAADRRSRLLEQLSHGALRYIGQAVASAITGALVARATDEEEEDDRPAGPHVRRR